MNGESLYAESHELLGMKEFRYCPGFNAGLFLPKAAVQQGIMKRGWNYFGDV